MLSKLKRHMNATVVLSPIEINVILQRVTDGIAQFVNFTCHLCPLRCMDNPRKGMADAFFSQTLFYDLPRK